eukprot:TRINITY_DN34640_c0_g1_i2.p1 TRINITY_DN34640_c0_g1~~TRINITY_DN34640_c0_g1_i2.p1  ORF type:complete len:175 (-),score=6.99 TRINITY_DN34640_c0_g1_i2:31-555(-)
MTVFGHSGGGFLAGKQVFPVDCEVEISQRLVEAAHGGDLRSALECIADPFVDVNFVGAVSLKSRKTEVVLHEESSDEVRLEYEEFKTEVSALFLAAHTGNLALVRKLLVYEMKISLFFYFSFLFIRLYFCMILKKSRSRLKFFVRKLDLSCARRSRSRFEVLRSETRSELCEKI